MNDATLHTENVIGAEELKGVIEKEVETLLELKEGDYCYIPDYEAYYGKKKENLLDGDGILRMNNDYIIQSTWKDGIIDGDLILWDTTRKRVAAFFVIQEGIIKQRLNVNTKDTLPDLNSRRYAYQGNHTLTDCRTWKEPRSTAANRFMIDKSSKQRPDRKEGKSVLSSSSYLVVQDNSESFAGVSKLVEILIIGKKCVTHYRDILDLRTMPSLREFHVSHGSFSCVTGLVISHLLHLTKVSIGIRCFNSNTTIAGKKACFIEDNPLLQSVTVSQGSFPCWGMLYVRRWRGEKD